MSLCLSVLFNSVSFQVFSLHTFIRLNYKSFIHLLSGLSLSSFLFIFCINSLSYLMIMKLCQLFLFQAFILFSPITLSSASPLPSLSFYFIFLCFHAFAWLFYLFSSFDACLSLPQSLTLSVFSHFLSISVSLSLSLLSQSLTLTVYFLTFSLSLSLSPPPLFPTFLLSFSLSLYLCHTLSLPFSCSLISSRQLDELAR